MKGLVFGGQILVALVHDAAAYVAGVASDAAAVARSARRGWAAPRACCRSFVEEPHARHCAAAESRRPS